MPGHRDWLNKAQGELKAAGILVHEHDILDIVAFHTHQCAEKALKGYLMFKQKTIPKTHILEDLLEVCFSVDQSFDVLLRNAIVLDPYATNTRYPNDGFSSITRKPYRQLIMPLAALRSSLKK